MRSLNRLFNPETIAIIGASDKPNRLGALALRALQEYDGDIFPVNPRLKKIGQSECYPTVFDIGVEVDIFKGLHQEFPTGGAGHVPQDISIDKGGEFGFQGLGVGAGG